MPSRLQFPDKVLFYSRFVLWLLSFHAFSKDSINSLNSSTVIRILTCPFTLSGIKISRKIIQDDAVYDTIHRTPSSIDSTVVGQANLLQSCTEPAAAADDDDDATTMTDYYHNYNLLS